MGKALTGSCQCGAISCAVGAPPLPVCACLDHGCRQHAGEGADHG